jgi:dTDP-4-amino-4,6-dideoxygalactose transaminase
VKLRHLPEWTSVRQRLAKCYDRALKELGSIIVPSVASDREHVYHLYVIRHPQRDALVAHLKKSGIQTVINYPTALPFLPAYQHLGHLRRIPRGSAVLDFGLGPFERVTKLFAWDSA